MVSSLLFVVKLNTFNFEELLQFKPFKNLCYSIKSSLYGGAILLVSVVIMT